MFALSIVILGTALYFLGSFQEMVTYRVEFPKVNGLAVDSPVHFNGVPIGRVTKIILADEGDPGQAVPIEVTLAVHRSAKEHIRHSTIADIKSIGILGDKYVLLITRDYTAPLLEEDGFIQPAGNSLDVDKLLEQGTDFVSDAGQITEDLKNLLGQMASGDGVFQRLIGDEKLATEISSALTTTVQRMNRDDTLLALVLNDPQFANQLKSDLLGLTKKLNALADQFNGSDGLVPALMNDPEYKAQVMEKVTQLLDSANGYVNRISTSRGLLYKMTEDEAYGERVSQNIEKASAHLASILEKIDEGDGTASLVVNDPRLYKGLYEVVYGLEHSGLSKWYIQKKRKKGNKLLENEENDEPKRNEP